MNTSLTFVEAPPGLAGVSDFRLRAIEAAEGLFALEAEAGLRLFVLDASVYLPDYAPVLSDAQTDLLGLDDPREALALVVANPGADGTTVNLLAPIVVNTSTGRAAQVILDGDWPLRAPLAPAA